LKLKDKLQSFVKSLKAEHKIEVKNMRCDNAGENETFIETCEKEGLRIHFKKNSSRYLTAK